MKGAIRQEPRRGECGCACHKGGAVLHPVPSCAPCPSCGLSIANGVLTHDCPGSLAGPRTWLAHGVRLTRSLTNYETAFSALMALVVMALAVMALPFPGYLVLLAAAIQLTTTS